MTSITPSQARDIENASSEADRVALNLTEADLAMFARLGITADLLKRTGVERVDNRTARERYGFRGAGDYTGIAFQYRDPLTGVRHTARLRRDRPEVEDGKQKNKYISACGDRRHLYFVSGCAELVRNPTVPVVLVEAEKSALALTAWAERNQQKLLPVAMGGCWGWRGRIGKTENSKGEHIDEVGPLPDLSRCSNRDVIIMLDSNADTKSEVRVARSALVRELEHMGAKVRIASVPALDRVNGPDDLIAVRGDDALQYVLEAAEPAAQLAVSEAEAAIGEILAVKPKISAEQVRRALDAVACVNDQIQRVMLEGRIAVAVRGVLPKATINRQVSLGVGFLRALEVSELENRLLALEGRTHADNGNS